MLAVKDLGKMTNAQLQAELKKKGLSESGKKAELIERLSEAIRKEEEDAILNAGMDSAEISADADLSAAEALLLNEPEDTSAVLTGDETVISEKAEEEEKNPIVEATNEDNKSKKKPVESVEAKLKRAQRLGLPIGVPAADNLTDVKQKRAERFGITPTVASEDAKAKRAERFGIDTANGKEAAGDDRKALRAARFGIDTTVVKNDSETSGKKDKLLARAMRFGIPVSADGKNVKRGAVDPEFEAKKKARAERFGLM